MRTQHWLVLGLLVILICGCGAKDPIIGKWADSKTGELLVEFKDGGSVIHDIDTDKMAARVLTSSRPEYAEHVKAQAGLWHEQMRSKKATWTKSGDMYAVNTEVFGNPGTIYYKLDQGNLKVCNKDGSQVGNLAYVPVKK